MLDWNSLTNVTKNSTLYVLEVLCKATFMTKGSAKSLSTVKAINKK